VPETTRYDRAMNDHPSRVTSAQVVAAYNGDQHALRLMPTAPRDPGGRMDIDGELPDITVTRDAALSVPRRLQRDPSTRMEAFLWSQMARLGTDFCDTKVMEVEIEYDPAYHEELCRAVLDMDYLDDGPWPEGHLEHLTNMLEEAPGRDSQ
jgi:hypothetical protein